MNKRKPKEVYANYVALITGDGEENIKEHNNQKKPVKVIIIKELKKLTEKEGLCGKLSKEIMKDNVTR